MKTINFSESFFKWQTIEQKTHGRFAIESTLRIFNNSGELINEYFLLSGVMASNVFHGNSLIITPTYFFQAAFSHADHKIFRTYSIQNKTRDSLNKNSLIFCETDFYVIKTEAKVLSDNKAIIDSTLSYVKLNGISRFKINGNNIYEIEYPVKHININDSQFQVESGPILLPGSKDSGNLTGMETAFLTFRDFNCGEFVRNTQTITDGEIFVRDFSLIDKCEIDNVLVTY